MHPPPPFFPVATDAIERDAISEVIPKRLFLTNWRGGSDPSALTNLKVTHIAAIGEEFVGSDDDLEGIEYYKHGERPPARHTLHYLTYPVDVGDDERRLHLLLNPIPEPEPSSEPSPTPFPERCRYWRHRRGGVQDGQLAPRGGGLYRQGHPGRRRRTGPLRRGSLAERYRSARLPGQGQEQSQA